MRKFGLIGYPLGHSFSKKYFTEKFRSEHFIGCSYDNYPLLNISDLPDLIKSEPELEGLNVTLPHKSEVLKFLDTVSAEAGEIGAVNVIKIKRQQGRIALSGFNSDVTGIRDSLAPYLGNYNGSAIILGTGGSSLAVKHVLEKMGINVIRVSRTGKEGVITYTEIDKDILERALLVVNTTPLGMYPNTDDKPELDYSLLGSRHILFDLVYNPEITSFLNMGRSRGCTTISGIKMLHSQAEKAWQIWNNDLL